ncbi:hypothetical protein L596_022375 [Steinernema carpocapsae]|uniref:Uncharacterized protein n=1 Tax=Steinernema carpocapsae TaxID=34508 RepID=A0A4U5MLI3_STECR|nr:hypothetical protein L596_022375 [Steinernema carpocapsae]
MGAQNVAVYKCEIFERFTVNRTFPRLTTDPSGSESFKFQVEHVNNTGQNLTLHIKPYNESCMSLKIEHSDLGKTNGNPPKTVTKTLKNPQGDVEFSGSFELQVKYFRYIDSEGCDPATDAFLDIETTWTSMAVKKMPVLVFIMIVLMAFL